MALSVNLVNAAGNDVSNIQLYRVYLTYYANWRCEITKDVAGIRMFDEKNIIAAHDLPSCLYYIENKCEQYAKSIAELKEFLPSHPEMDKPRLVDVEADVELIEKMDEMFCATRDALRCAEE